jgi:hypothetical protein
VSGHLPKLYIICLASAYQRPPGKQPDPSSECGDACICEQSRQVRMRDRRRSRCHHPRYVGAGRPGDWPLLSVVVPFNLCVQLDIQEQYAHNSLRDLPQGARQVRHILSETQQIKLAMSAS